MSDRKTLIAIPAMDVCPIPFAYSLATLRRDCPSRISIVSGAAVHEARNTLAREALENECERVLWLDSDMAFDGDLMIRLGEDLDAGWDMVSGIYFKRQLPAVPVLYKSIKVSDECEVYEDYPADTLFPVAGCGFGAVMMKTELLRTVTERGFCNDGPFTPMKNLGEDLSFCWRAKLAGGKIGCDSRIKVGHVGQIVYSEKMYRRPE